MQRHDTKLKHTKQTQLPYKQDKVTCSLVYDNPQVKTLDQRDEREITQEETINTMNDHQTPKKSDIINLKTHREKEFQKKRKHEYMAVTI